MDAKAKFDSVDQIITDDERVEWSGMSTKPKKVPDKNIEWTSVFQYKGGKHKSIKNN